MNKILIVLVFLLIGCGNDKICDDKVIIYNEADGLLKEVYEVNSSDIISNRCFTINNDLLCLNKPFDIFNSKDNINCIRFSYPATLLGVE